MTAFINTNPHRVYIEDPDNDSEQTVQGLLRVGGHQEFEATGSLAERAETVQGVEKAGSKAGKEFTKNALPDFELLTEPSGPKAFPAEGEEVEGPTARGDTGGGDSGGYESRTVKQLAKLARERDLDVVGTGKGGRPTKADYIAALRG